MIPACSVFLHEQAYDGNCRKAHGEGLCFNELLDQTFFQKTYLQNQILGRALLESMLLMDGKCIISALRKKDLDFYGVTSEDLDGIVSQLRNTTAWKWPFSSMRRPFRSSR